MQKIPATQTLQVAPTHATNTSHAKETFMQDDCRSISLSGTCLSSPHVSSGWTSYLLIICETPLGVFGIPEIASEPSLA